MVDKIRIGLVGLGETGEAFAEHLLEHIQLRHVPVEIRAAVHSDPESPAMIGFAQSGVSVFTDPADLVRLGESLDVIFDLSGDPHTQQKLRFALLSANNLHTIVAPATIARLLWYFLGESRDVPELRVA